MVANFPVELISGQTPEDNPAHTENEHDEKPVQKPHTENEHDEKPVQKPLQTLEIDSASSVSASELANPNAAYLTNFTLLCLTFGVMFAMLMPSCFKKDGISEGCHHPALPGGAVFDLLEVLVVGYLGGACVRKLGLPPLFGMLIAGYLLKNLIPDQLDGLSATLNSTLRNVALAIIMLRAGMGLNIAKLRESSFTTALLATGPCCAEAATIALAAKFIFPVMSTPFCFMLGFCIADVSPAVTTPIFLDFMDQGIGTKKGIPTILLAAGSVNSVVAIVLYSVVNEFAWTDDVSAAKLAEIIGVKLVAQIVGVGAIAGYLFGRGCEYCWRWARNEYERFFILFLTALFILFGFKAVGMGGGGTLAVLTCGATLQNTLKDPNCSKPVSDIMASLWQNCGAVMLFTLLGASVDQSKLEVSKVFLGAAIIIIGLAGRGLATFGCASLIREWNAKEKAFAMVSWCPKATVQAALATVSLDLVNKQVADGVWSIDDPYTQDMLERANVILTTAVLSIMMTAPLFAVLMAYTGPRWLEQDVERAAMAERSPMPTSNLSPTRCTDMGGSPTRVAPPGAGSDEQSLPI